MRLVLSPEDYEERKNVIAFLCIENEKDKNYDVILNELILIHFFIFKKNLTMNLIVYLILIIFKKIYL